MDLYIDNLLKNYRTYTGYQAPTRTKEDYLQEIRGLEREIQIAKERIAKLDANSKKS